MSLHAPTTASPRRSIMRYAVTAVRILMGLLFCTFGLNGWLNFIPQPATPLPPAAVAFATALMNTGYMMPLISGTQLIVGALLLANRFVPLALVLLAPFMVNSIAFHVVLEPAGRPMAFTIFGLQLFLAWSYRDSLRPLLTARHAPHGRTLE